MEMWITILCSQDHLHDRGVVHYCGDETFMLSLWEWQEISRKAMTERNVILCSCVDIELQVISASTAGRRWASQATTKSWEKAARTLSPERITCFPSSKGLYLDDLVQWTTRLFFRLRCSCLRALAWVCLMASAAPKTEAKATINDTCCDMLL